MSVLFWNKDVNKTEYYVINSQAGFTTCDQEKIKDVTSIITTLPCRGM